MKFCAVSLLFFAAIVISVECSIYIQRKPGMPEFNFDDLDLLRSRYLSTLYKNYRNIYNNFKRSPIDAKENCLAFNGSSPTAIGRVYIASNELIKKSLKYMKEKLAIGDDENNSTQPEFKKIVENVLGKYLKLIDDVYREYDSMETRKFTRIGLIMKIKSLTSAILGNNTFPLINALNKVSADIAYITHNIPYMQPEWRQCDKYELMQDSRLYMNYRLVFAELRVFYMTLQMCSLSLFSDGYECDSQTTFSIVDKTMERIEIYFTALKMLNDELQPKCKCLKSLEQWRYVNRLGVIEYFVKIPTKETEKMIRVFTNITEHICFHLSDIYREYMWEICYGEDMNTQDVIRQNGLIEKVVVIEDRNRFEPNVMRQFTITCSDDVWKISYTEPNNLNPRGELSFEETCDLLDWYTLTAPHIYNDTLLWVLADVAAQPMGISPLVAGVSGCYCDIPENDADLQALVEADTTRVCRSVSSDGFNYVDHLLKNKLQLTEDNCIPKHRFTPQNLKQNGWAIYSGCTLPKGS